jgi:hypothetical protein
MPVVHTFPHIAAGGMSNNRQGIFSVTGVVWILIATTQLP